MINRRRMLLQVILTVVICAILLYIFGTPFGERGRYVEVVSMRFRDDATGLHTISVRDEDGDTYRYNRQSPLIFIGGVPRSGTTLMRAMLDAHPHVRCGEETRVVPRILQLNERWHKNEKESKRLAEAGVSDPVLAAAISAFILEVIVGHGRPARRLCNKDPLALKSATYLNELFPKAKFIYMIRDGRATVHSLISRKVTVTGFDLTSYRQSLQKWNSASELILRQCDKLGPHFCLKVHYEQLVLHPKQTMEEILYHLELPWNDLVLHHEDLIGADHGVKLSKIERSSNQVIKPVNTEALSKWVGHIPDDVVADMDVVAPMLRKLGYDPLANPPNYGQPDEQVVNNTRQIEKDRDKWRAIEEQVQIDI